MHTTMLYETLQFEGLAEVARTVIRLLKKPMNLCIYNNEEREKESLMHCINGPGNEGRL